MSISESPLTATLKGRLNQLTAWLTLPIWKSGVWVLPALIFFTLMHGLLYVFIVPPWQHYDEPNHFEYVWLLVNRGSPPQPGDYDLEMRREVARSMIENGFYRDFIAPPDLTVQEGSIWIGSYSQLDDPPLYYLLASVPLRLFQFQSIETQLYTVRFVSLLLFILTVFIAWGLVSELTPPGSSLRWLVPLAVAMVPAFADIMTAANNDAGAVFTFSLFLWGAVRLIRRGFSLPGLAWVIAVAAACFFTKNNVYIAVPLVIPIVLLSIFPAQRRWIAWAGLVLAGLVAGMYLLPWGDAALWYRHTYQIAANRIPSQLAPLGEYVFALEIPANFTSHEAVYLKQPIPPSALEGFRGESFTLGAWMWASRQEEALTPTLNLDNGRFIYSEPVYLTNEPAFFAFTVYPDEVVTSLAVELYPLRKAVGESFTVYYDGLLLVEGEWPVGVMPKFTSSDGAIGDWGSRPFTNLLRNASGESAWPRVRPLADRLGEGIIPHGRPSLILYSLLDWEGAGWYYKTTSEHLFRSFWGKFGWGHVSLIGNKPYRPVLFFTLIGLAGFMVGLVRWRKTVNWHILLFVSLTLALVWGSTLIRGVPYMWLRIFIPTARYAYPVIIPTMFLLLFGWRAIWPARAWKYIKFGLVIGLIWLDAVAIYSVWLFYTA
jgi:hypothetical protein